MKAKEPTGPNPIRQFGQRPLQPIFHRSSRCKEVNVNQGAKISKPSISLSKFLDRKLSKTMPQKSMQGKEAGFPSLGGRAKSLTGKTEVAGRSALDGRAFRCSGVGGKTDDEGEAIRSLDLDLICELAEADEQDLRKTERPRTVGEGRKLPAAGSIFVLGDDPKPRQRRISELVNKTSSGSHFNHYANGNGWWESGMEGVDSEEVGFKETWEGMGSTSLGGLQWQDLDL
ncbi:hypothetical protein EJ110_NYTH26880 [Nymphaea thermarum]|nr:hypothetical protein EJ110_NYTH26880 [Nymphaea thermarum]